MPSLLERMLGELPARNEDNVSRTESYLELYAFTRAHPPDLPWLLIAHLVSRNGGYSMTDVALSIMRGDAPLTLSVQEEVFLMLERCNVLIFYDAWHHEIMHLLGRSAELAPPRSPQFVCESWGRYERAGDETRLVDDLVTNEQSLIERRVVRNPSFSRALAVIAPIRHLLQMSHDVPDLAEVDRLDPCVAMRKLRPVRQMIHRDDPARA